LLFTLHIVKSTQRINNLAFLHLVTILFLIVYLFFLDGLPISFYFILCGFIRVNRQFQFIILILFNRIFFKYIIHRIIFIFDIYFHRLFLFIIFRLKRYIKADCL